MDTLYKREEKTASEKQVVGSVRTMLGIMEHNREIELPKDKKQMKKLLADTVVPAFERYLITMKHTWTSADTSAIMSMSDWSKFDKCYKYLSGADVPKGIKECLIAAVTEQAFVAEEAPKAKPKKLTKAQQAKATKAAKAAMTLQTKTKPVDSKPLTIGIKLTDELYELGRSSGMEDSEIAKFAHLLAKENS